MVGPLSAIQPFSHPLTLNCPRSLGYIRKLAFGSPWKNYSPPVCLTNHTAPRNIKLAETLPSQGTNIYTGRVEPRRFISYALHVRPVQDSNQEPLDLQLNALPLGQRAPLIMLFKVNLFCTQKEAENIFKYFYNSNFISVIDYLIVWTFYFCR